MKILTAIALVSLWTLPSFAQKMECSIDESIVKSGQVMDWSPSQVIQDGKTTTLSLQSGATLNVDSAKVCAADGGPCSTNSRLSLTLKLGDASASTMSMETVVSLKLENGQCAIRASCHPAIGQ